MVICSLNVRGLSDSMKRRETLRWLKLKKYSIYFLQEVHCTKENECLWMSEWGYRAIFSNLTSSRAGVCILFNNNFSFEITKQFSDPEGRFIIADIKTEQKTITLVNIYAPNSDDPSFFINVYNHLLSFECENLVLGGDFNLVQNVLVDKKGGNKTTHLNALKELEDIKTKLDLTDIWRDLNPDIRRYTWRRRNPEIHCRLDFFLISSSVSTSVSSADIHPGYKTDHSLVTIHINTTINARGPGFWKLNTHFLSEIEYINLIKSTITGVVNDYENDNEVDDILMWEMIKMAIRTDSLKYSKEKRKKLKEEEVLLENEILFLEKTLEEENLSNEHKENIEQNLDDKITRRNKINEYKTKGCIIRAKTKWYNEGEKNTKYFLGLERRHYNHKTIRLLKKDDGSNLYTDKEILNETKTFYRNLYTTTHHSDKPQVFEDYPFFQQENKCKLSDNDKEICEGLLTAAECLESLKQMESNKTPGIDGLPADFYKVFWFDIHLYLLKSLNLSYKKGLLAISQRRGLISLIPKKKKALYYTKNWRPITLLNCDYKIATKAIASRMKKVLPNIINYDQTGFLKNRSISENIRLIDGIITYADQEKISGMLVFLDFEKAFDSIEWSFIRKTLTYYNFGESLIAWVELFYTDISSCIQNNGWTSGFFGLTRGVRQGCPLSPYLFILCAEILATAIRHDKQIKGIKILRTECKISQYADDTTLILDGTEKSLKKALTLLALFASISGLKINYEKTEILCIGTLKYKQNCYFLEQKLKWAKQKVQALGVWFSTKDNESVALNYFERKAKLNAVLNTWQFRRLTLLGKITVIKSLAASQLVYILSPFPSSEKDLKEINQSLFSFIWDGRKDKIKRSEMINEYKKGGLKMLDIQTFNRAQKAKWIQKYLNCENYGKWKLLFDVHLDKHGGKQLFSFNLKRKDVSLLKISDPFLEEILEVWADLKFESNPKDMTKTTIWYNSLIRIDGTPFLYKNWMEAGICVIADILNCNNNFLPYKTFRERFKLNTTFINYFSVISAIKATGRPLVSQLDKDSCTMEKILKSKNFSKTVYKHLLNKIATIPKKSNEKWILDLAIFDIKEFDWEKTYTLPFLCTKETKLRIFQFKLLHRRIATNTFLCKIGVKDADKCSFCKSETESLIHLFWDCTIVKEFWNNVKNWIKENIKPKTIINLTKLTCLGFVQNTSNILLHHVLLIARHYIYCCRLKTTLPICKIFESIVQTTNEIEKVNAFKMKTQEMYNKKWADYRNPLTR